MSSPFRFAFCSEIRNAYSHRPRPNIFHPDWIYFKSNEPGNSRLVYVKHTFSTNCILQRTSRLHQMHTLKIKCRLVYTKCLFFLESDVWSPPNAYLGKQVRDRAQTRMWLSGEIIGNAFCKVASRLSKTHTFKKRHFAPRVSSTPNAHSKNQVSSRLRQMPFVLKKGRLAYNKSLFGKQSEPRGAKPSRAACGRPRVIDSPITQNSIRTKKNRLAYTKRIFFWSPFFELWSMPEILDFASQLYPPTCVSST